MHHFDFNFEIFVFWKYNFIDWFRFFKVDIQLISILRILKFFYFIENFLCYFSSYVNFQNLIIILQ